jgi:outer membrane protein assembly factor BamB
VHHSGVPLTRRRLLATAATGSAAALLPAWPRAARARGWWDDDGRDWPSAGHDLAGTRAAPVSVRRSARVRWVAHLAGGVPGAAAIAGRTVVAASLGSEVAAFDLLTGRERWRVAPPREGFFAGPAIAGDRVVVASDRATALDLRTGRTLWVADSLRAGDSDDYFWGSPTIVAGLVLIGSGSAGEGAGGGGVRGRLSAYDLRTGRLRWSTTTVEPGANGGGVMGPPTVDLLAGKAYITTGAPYAGAAASGTSSLIEVRLVDGAITWIAPSNQPNDLNSAALLLGRRVYATGKDGVHAWDRPTRAQVWHTAITPPKPAPGPTDGPEFGPLASDGRRLYALSNDNDNNAFTAAALDPRTGAILWRTDLPGFAFAAPALAGDRLYTATAAGALHALALRDGTPTDTYALGDLSAGAIASASGYVLAGTGAGADLPGETLTAIG